MLEKSDSKFALIKRYMIRARELGIPDSQWREVIASDYKTLKRKLKELDNGYGRIRN